MQAVLQAVSTPRRREILRLVWDAELPAGEIAAHFEVSWPAVSQNLKVLREAGAVIERRDRNRRLYRADRRALRPVAPLLKAMWEADLAELRRLAELDRASARRSR
jgi:DNA-binding transcriptional ArsR family regulator